MTFEIIYKKTMWVPIDEAWPAIGKKPLLITDGDFTIRAFTVHQPNKAFPYGIVVPEYAHNYFKSKYITHWIYIKNLNYMEYLMYFPKGNHEARKCEMR
jgi:hypothetical protein